MEQGAGGAERLDSRAGAARKTTAGLEMAKLTSDHIANLGRATDKSIAEAAGCSKFVVFNARKLRGIPAFVTSKSAGYVWDDDATRLLGTMPDAAIAEKLGVHQTAVCQARRRREIPAYGAARANGRFAARTKSVD